MLGFVGLDEIQKLLSPLRLANCEGQSEGQPVIGRFEQIEGAFQNALRLGAN